MTVRLSGTGGHTSRPHLTQDLTYALGKLVTDLPAALSRRLDPRAGASVVWGVGARRLGQERHPRDREAAGTVRMLDAVAWADAEDLIRELIDQILAPYGVKRRSATCAACRRSSTTPRAAMLPRRCAEVLGPVGGAADPAEPRRRGLRLVPRAGPRRDGPARDPNPGRPHLRPAPGQPASSTSGAVGRRPAARARRPDHHHHFRRERFPVTDR